MRLLNMRWVPPTIVGALLLSAGVVFARVHVARGEPQQQTAPDDETIAAFARGGCAGCHTIPGIPDAAGAVGPNLAAIGSAAGSRDPGLDAEAYIRQSILEPNAFIAPQCPAGDCPSNVMPPNLAEKLSPTQIDAIVAYLLTLGGEAAPVPELYVLEPIAIERPPEASGEPFAETPGAFSDAEVLLGKYLFFDPRLSGDATISCAACHQPDRAWTDGKPLSDGYPSTLYFRNTPTVLNTTFQDWLYWDGRMDGGDMPTLVRDHITEAHFMNSDGRLMAERLRQVPEYVQLFQDAYGAGPSFGRTLKAVSAYVQSLNSTASAYDRYLSGDEKVLSEDARAGLELFTGAAGCAACHNGPTLSDGDFYALGVPENDAIWADPLRHITFRRFFRLFGTPNYRALDADPGLYALTLAEADRGSFRTAPLREVARTAPYMHNGVFTTLEEVVQFYNAGAATGEPLGLDDEQVGQIVAFLESLSTEPATVTPPRLPQYQLRTLGENK